MPSGNRPRPRRSPATSPAQFPAARLLPRPHGFEGLGPLLIQAYTNDRAVAKREDLGVARRYFDPVSTPSHHDVGDDNVLARVDEFLRLDSEVVEQIQPLLREAFDRLDAAIDALLGTARSRPINLSVRV